VKLGTPGASFELMARQKALGALLFGISGLADIEQTIQGNVPVEINAEINAGINAGINNDGIYVADVPAQISVNACLSGYCPSH
jgi:hypothetical protein